MQAFLLFLVSLLLGICLTILVQQSIPNLDILDVVMEIVK